MSSGIIQERWKAMFGLRTPELLVIGLIVLVLFGPGKLAGLGKGLGQGIRDFKKAMAGEDEQKPEITSAEKRASESPPQVSATDDGRRT
jgi:sec-independent protein translocase protein TatA